MLAKSKMILFLVRVEVPPFPPPSPPQKGCRDGADQELTLINPSTSAKQWEGKF